jgi:hypothetical protein
MMGRQIRRATPRPGSGLTADLFLLHARSVSVYEMYPIGWFSIKQRSAACGFDAKIDAYIMLYLESHDPKISAAAGRGTYTMAEMEDWIPRALDAGAKGIMVWFFIGIPYPGRQPVPDTVAYSERLIRKFGGWKALPLICPMVPFLDPGSRFFEEPAQHRYRIFHRTLEEHGQAIRTIDATVPRQMIEDRLASVPARRAWPLPDRMMFFPGPERISLLLVKGGFCE